MRWASRGHPTDEAHPLSPLGDKTANMLRLLHVHCPGQPTTAHRWFALEITGRPGRAASRRTKPARAVRQYDAGIEAATAAMTPASLLLRGGQAAYLLSASIRRSVSSSTLPVLGSSRAASWSLSSALVRPS